MSDRPKAAIYCRVSTTEQAEKGASIEGQKKYLQELAEDLDIDIVKEYVDAGRSASSIDRESLQELLSDAETQEFNALLLYHNDRLSRNTEDILRICRELKDLGVLVKFGNIDLDITTPEGKMLLGVNALFSEYFLADLKRKTRLGMKQKKLEGTHTGRISKYYEKIVKFNEDGSIRKLTRENVRPVDQYSDDILVMLKMWIIDKKSYRSISRDFNTTHKTIKRAIDTYFWLGV